MNQVVSVRGLSRAFGGPPVLRGVDLDVFEGETVALLGPSGSGKSTILRIIAGLDRPDRGRVELRGEDAAALGPERRDVGYVFQDLALFPHLDVGANVAFGLRMRGVRHAERGERVGEVLELVGLAGSESRDPGSLSGGERQRVALARALAPRPRLLLLDEPFGALDRTLRDRLLLELRDLFADLGLAVLAVTHDPDEAAALADRLAVLLAGRIAQSGAPGEVIGQPADVAVARLMGHRNLVPARPTAGGLEVAWGTIPAAEVRPGDDVGHVLVRPGAVRRDESGSLTAQVIGTMLRGGAPVVRLAVAGTLLEATGWDPVPPDGPVRIRIDPSGCLPLPEAEAGRGRASRAP